MSNWNTVLLLLSVIFYMAAVIALNQGGLWSNSWYDFIGHLCLFLSGAFCGARNPLEGEE